MAAKKTNKPAEDPRGARIAAAVGSDVPHLYANSFALVLSNSDVTISLERNGFPQASLNMSYTLAKTLAVKLGVAIAEFETMTGRSMLVTDEVEEYSRKAQTNERR